MKRRLADMPLHRGKAPPWLFRRMARMAGGITMAVVDTFGSLEMLRRLADPWWFQAFGCVLGFDWHSSGLTTVTCGALKEAQRIFGDDLGIFVAGGKGSTSRRTPTEIKAAADRHGISQGDRLIFASKMSAKVDSAAVQDGYQLYHHSFVFTRDAAWCVVQQGMNDATSRARRYHWLSQTLDNFVCEPHEAIHDGSGAPMINRDSIRLNMVAHEAQANRKASSAVARLNPDHVMDQLRHLTDGPTLFAPSHHPILTQDINVDHLRRIIRTTHEQHPSDFVALLGTQGVGPATVRSLSLLAELIFDAPSSNRDLTPRPDAMPSHEPPRWADYAFAHGGKDGTPFPVDRKNYDRNIEILVDAVRRARIGDQDKTEALRRLARRYRS